MSFGNIGGQTEKFWKCRGANLVFECRGGKLIILEM